MKRKGQRPGTIDTGTGNASGSGSADAPGSDDRSRLPPVGSPGSPHSVRFTAPVGAGNTSPTAAPVPPLQQQVSGLTRTSTVSPRLRPGASVYFGALQNAEAERKRKLVRTVPLLKHLTKEQHCNEDDLVEAFRIVSYLDGDYIYCQGQTERDIYFIEDGRVLITQRKPGATPGRVVARRRSALEAELEQQIAVHQEYEYFGEMAMLQCAPRKHNAVAQGSVVCMALDGDDYQALLGPVLQLLLYRHQLRTHSVLEKNRLLKDFTPQQHQYLLNHTTLVKFEDGDYICRQGEVEDRYYILCEGEAKIVLEEHLPDTAATRSRASSVIAAALRTEQNPEGDDSGVEVVQCMEARGGYTRSSVVAEKNLYQGFGEMGLLEKPRTAHVIAVGSVLTVVITRQAYVGAAQLLSTTIDADAESLLATTLIEEWNLVINARNLHLSNPRVAHYLVTFIKKFKGAYNQKFVGKTMYLDFFRRLHQEPHLTAEFDFIASRITWDSPSSSLSILRPETRRVLTQPPAMRAAADLAFVGRLIEHTAFLDKFEMPPGVDKYKVARQLGKVLEFVHIMKDSYLFRQGKVESKAFVILRGKINIVNEDLNSSNTVRHNEIIATLSAGDSFGELSLVTRLQRSATAMAPCDTDLLVLDRDHLHAVMAALPGVSVRHAMVERAEFLARLSFFKGCDFGQCIRVAHDMQEVMYETRHLFLQEPAHLRTLYIVKSGEIAVFLPQPHSVHAASLTHTIHAAHGHGHGALHVAPPKPALIRVATIGPLEFFGVAIVHANLGQGQALNATAGVSPTTGGTTSAVDLPKTPSSGNQMHQDLSSTVFMCTTRAQVLELSERGWRRLNHGSLQIVRNVLLERHRWHHELLDKQCNPTLYHGDKPWQLLVRGANVTTTGKVEEPRTTQLARHVKDKKAAARGNVVQYFNSPAVRSAIASDDGTQSRAAEVRTPTTASWDWSNSGNRLGGSFLPSSPRKPVASDSLSAFIPIGMPKPSPRRRAPSTPIAAKAAVAAAAVGAQTMATMAATKSHAAYSDPSDDAFQYMWRAGTHRSSAHRTRFELGTCVMAPPPQRTTEASGARAATYWLFKRLVGLQHVAVPETALFDDEGVLEAWLYVPATSVTASPPPVTAHEFVQLRLLRFEARLQELAKCKGKTKGKATTSSSVGGDPVALHWKDVPVALDEIVLDRLVRLLCAREVAIRNPEPDMTVPRKALDGPFCLQQFVAPVEQLRYRCHVRHTRLVELLQMVDGAERTTASMDVSDIDPCEYTRFEDYADDVAMTITADRKDSGNSSIEIIADEDVASTQAVANRPVRAVDHQLRDRALLVLQHLHSQEWLVQELVFEFVVATTSTQPSIVLVGAHRVAAVHFELKVHRTKHKGKHRSTSSSTTHVPTKGAPSHRNYRICRSCRGLDELSLAQELNGCQDALRGVLTKYQTALEQVAVLTSATDRLQHTTNAQLQTLRDQQHEIERLQQALLTKTLEHRGVAKSNTRLQRELNEALAELQSTQQALQRRIDQVHDLNDQRIAAERAQQERDSAERSMWKAKVHEVETQVEQLQKQVTELTANLVKAQQEREEMCAERDELSFRWGFVCRKLTDINEPGVAPPKRVAGGFSCYPTPSTENVTEVVRWLVDYEAKKTVIEAQKQSVQKRLRLKLKLLRALAAPPAHSHAQTARPSSASKKNVKHGSRREYDHVPQPENARETLLSAFRKRTVANVHACHAIEFQFTS
ncbi:TPA: hypothetical protein N0F65_001474 [Lagenidium giganteum]|uniref:Cyclic nucleotide-binding domain-containing protein n=1 Tax=Lagenidium giganteum TaxID=4803 RepID=A0AAV2YL46_9STRA|nr:TPA: hypothetical protein N0F65_001474 [Lagenidium giganteum]